MSVIDSKVINVDELKLEHFANGDRFASASRAHGRCAPAPRDNLMSSRGRWCPADGRRTA